MAVALLALFVALGGGAYAAFNLPDNSVTGPKVKNGSLGPEDIDSIIARPHGSEDVVTGTSASPANYSLKPAKWAQAKGEVDQLVLGITSKSPATCGGTIPVVFANVLIDGKSATSTFLSAGPAGSTQTATAAVLIPEAASKKTNKVTLQAYDTCDGPSESFTIKSVKGDVIAFR